LRLSPFEGLPFFFSDMKLEYLNGIRVHAV
jgi:hypothetical protein